MNYNKNKKLVLFGAGKIGRSFIGQIFSRAGYEVVFADINKQLINLMNIHKQYKVVIKSQNGDEQIIVNHIRGIHFFDFDAVVNELSDASLCAISVGQHGIPITFPIIAQALNCRLKKHGMYPLDIIIAENMRNADKYISEELSRLLPNDYPIDSLVGLVETSIGKMVPIMTQKDIEEDPLQVFAEPYNFLIVAKNGFKNPVPEIEFLSPKENIKAWVDCKLFIHNLGHVTAAYLGFQRNHKWIFIHEALADPEIFETTRNAMLQSAEILLALYPEEFTFSQMVAHIDDLLHRFQNKALGDTIFRVGSDLYRKLNPEDRLVAPINAAIKLNKPFDLILRSLTAALSFRATDENGKFFPSDERFIQEVEKDPDYILEKICCLQKSNLTQ